MQPFLIVFMTLATGILGRDVGFTGIPRFPFPDELTENERIVGGQPASIENHGHQAALLLEQPNQSPRLRCGAGALSEHWALSAAHCNIANNVAGRLWLRVGSSYHAKDGQLLEVENFMEHPEYVSFFLWNDIGLIKTKESIVFEGHVKAIYLEKRTPETDEWLEVCGWGRQIEADGNSIPDDLRMVQLQKSSDDDCRRTFGFADLLSQFCAGGPVEGDKGVCFGDSGSPIYSIRNGKQLAVGLVSGGYVCAGPNIPSIFTRLATFIPWIENIIGKRVTYEDDGNEIVDDVLLPMIST